MAAQPMTTLGNLNQANEQNMFSPQEQSLPTTFGGLGGQQPLGFGGLMNQPSEMIGGFGSMGLASQPPLVVKPTKSAT